MKKLLPLLLMALAGAGAASAASKELGYHVIGLYDAAGYDVPNYFVLLSDSESAKYDQRTAAVSITDGYVLQLDLYNDATDPAVVPAATYTPNTAASTALRAGTYDPEYTKLFYYKDGKQYGNAVSLLAPVEINRLSDGSYTLSTTATDPVTETSLDITFKGRLPLNGTNDKPSAFTQLRRDLDVTLDKGGIAFYQGVTDYSNNGVSYINLYSGKFNEGGGMTEDGVNLAMMVAHKRFVKKTAYTIVDGEYVAATDLARFTWYPCREIDYSVGSDVVSMPFGSFIRVRQNGEYVYGYLKTGTFTIESDGNGNVSGQLDAYTDLGYHVTATFSGPMGLNTDNATFKSAISDLSDDVDLDFSTLEKGRIYHTGITGGCRTFIVDLGSPSGKDAGVMYGGDILRMEFLSPVKTAVLQPGLYTVIPVRWNSYELAAGGTYEPMSLNKGYFGNGGEQIGTRYAHFEEGRYLVYDCVGPADEGTVLVETDDYINYRFDIKLVDDAGFEIRGTWDKPLEYQYDNNALAEELGLSGVSVAAAEGSAIGAVVEGRRVVVLNGGNSPVAILDLDGRLAASGTADEAIDVAALAPGIYILSINNQSIKIAVK